jgi:hypothetical protein
MKKLLDETTDELTRELLLAGVEHRPPSGNKAQLLVALGAGSALGLFSSNALAWFGTSAGKLTVLGVTLGVAGAVYVVAPLWTAGPSTQRAPEGSALRAISEPEAPVSGSTPGAAAAVVPAADVPDRPAVGGLVPSEGRPDPAPDGESLPPKREPRRNGPLPAVSTLPAVGALGEQRVDRSRLDAEVRLVDDMHWAARRNDREALGRFLETYRLTFPDGELKKEVSEFAVRLERPANR